MNIIGAVRSFFRDVFSGGGRLHRFAPGVINLACLSVLRVQFALGLQPMRLLLVVTATRFLPNLIGPPGDVFVAD